VEIADTIKPLSETPLEKLAKGLHGDYQWLNIQGNTPSVNELNTAQKNIYENTSSPPLTEMVHADFRFTDDVSRPGTQKNSPFGKEIVTDANRFSDDDSSASPKRLPLPDAEILEIETDARIVYMSGFTSSPQSPQMLRVGAENRLALWIRGASAELPAAEYLIGLCYKNGVRVTSDENKALQCQLKAAWQGCQPAMFLVAMEYKARNETNPSDKNAIPYAKYWAEKGAKLGEPLAQCFWANHFTNTPEDRSSWLEKAANQDLPEAQYLLGKCFETGNGVGADKGMAAVWYEKSAKQGFAAAQMAVEQLNAEQLNNGTNP
jgi:TPR repeat protein